MKKSIVPRNAVCIKCGKEFIKKNICKPNKYCSIECRRSKTISFTTCQYCGKEFMIKYPRNPNKFCNRSCQGNHFWLYEETAEQKLKRYRATALSNTKRLKGTKSPESSKRMKENNPMFNPVIRAKMTATIRARKSWLGERGGNGFVTQPQMILAEALFVEETLEYVINLKKARKYFHSLPTHYCVDLAIPELKIAIEVDGNSHKTKKWRYLDKRKTEVLNFLGWIVIRFWNEEVTQDVSGCISKVEFYIAARLQELITNQSLIDYTVPAGINTENRYHLPPFNNAMNLSIPFKAKPILKKVKAMEMLGQLPLFIN